MRLFGAGDAILDLKAKSLAIGPGALLIALVLIWAASWPIIKVGVQDMPPIWFGVLRYAIACVIVFPTVALWRGWVFPAPRDWALIVISGTLQMGAYAASWPMPSRRSRLVAPP